ncbi:unnamed protein product [Pocillopora meandrina]|uniref:C-type lectin domain-containing protein n=1 Tax=Pocillopora meandrina TaxID=46732 RepID=A0AAU9XTH3_9CNID|nr:unnamed protein product [Pocillopora meandrina]
MWRKYFVTLALVACLELQVIKGTFHIKPKSHKAKWTDDRESKQVKRDTVPSTNGYPSYGSQYTAQATTSYNSAAYNTGQSRSAMPYPASSPSPAPATASASSSAPAPATATAAAGASAQGAVAATAQAAAPAPATAPAAAASAPAAASAAAAPAPAPAAAAAAPAPAPASPASAPASSTTAQASAGARASVPYSSSASATYQPSSQSYSYNYNPAPAPAPYYSSYPAPAAYAYPAPAPARSATALIAAAVAQVAKSTSTQVLSKLSSSTGVCLDDERANNFCLKARNPCFCEENHHFMYNYCKDSCNWCDSSENIGHRFWRIVNEAKLPRSWVLNKVQFFADKHAKRPLDTQDPRKAFASSSYLGYEPGSAFDNRSSTYWLPNGWYSRGPGEDFIGYEFNQPVAINSVRVVHQSGQGNVVSKKMYVEAADAYAGPYVTKWIIENTRSKSSKRFNNKMCPLFWRRFSTDQGVYCFRLMTDFNTWHGARDKCAEYGADLASIKGEEEADFVKNQVQLCGFTWIGLNDMKNESDFMWSDGSNMTYKSMSPQMDYVKDERADQEMDCVATDQNGQWTTFHCDDKFYFLCKKKLTGESADDDDDDEDEEDEDTEEVHHHKKHHKAHLKYRHHALKKNKVKNHTTKHSQKVTLAEELKEAKSNNTEDEQEEETADEDAIREAVKAQKSSKEQSDEDEEEDDDEDDEDSGSGSGRSASTIPNKPNKRSPHKKIWEF